jgi:hypothetical protein
MTEKNEALRLAEYLDMPHIAQHRSAAELRRLSAENAAWEQKSKTWLASPEAADRLEGYRNLAQRLSIVEQHRDELLGALTELVGHTNKRFTGGVWDRARAAIRAMGQA